MYRIATYSTCEGPTAEVDAVGRKATMPRAQAVEHGTMPSEQQESQCSPLGVVLPSQVTFPDVIPNGDASVAEYATRGPCNARARSSNAAIIRLFMVSVYQGNSEARSRKPVPYAHRAWRSAEEPRFASSQVLVWGG
jgi:hypothetical protein